MTITQQAVRLLLNNDQTGLTRLARRVDRAIEDAIDPACRACGARGLEDNGCAPGDIEFTLLCTSCGDQHSPNI